MIRRSGVIVTPYDLCYKTWEARKRMSLTNIIVKKPGVVSSFIISDLKPCVSADVLCGNQCIHIERAVFDTGSNTTVIVPSELRSSLSAEEIDMASVDTIGTGHVYRVQLSLDNGEIVLDNVPLVDFDLSIFEDLDIKMIIGMDVITAGRLVVDAGNHIPHFSFEVK